ncbi:MAG TPA: hypothetical protein VF144_04585, partial [Chitinophagaceae bacterium]
MNRSLNIKLLSGCLVCLIFQLISFGVLAQDVKKFDISGRLNTNYNGQIYLKYHIIPDSPLSYQTTVVNGNFYFKVDLVESVAAVLSLPSPSTSEYMYLDTAAMIVNANIDSFMTDGTSISSLKIVSIQGSEGQRIYTALMARWKSIFESRLSEKVRSDYLFGTLDSLVKLYPDHNILTQALFF